jgi:arylsulfatase A-like enzyme
MDMLYEMDLVVGSLVSLIEDKGLAEDTIIIFASDNGGLGDMHGTPSDVHDSSGPLRGSKAMIYEGGHRIPMIIRHDKSFPPNEERSHLVGLNDLYATLLDLVGVAVPNLSAQDSMSFSDYIFSGSNTNGLREELATFAFQYGSFFVSFTCYIF